MHSVDLRSFLACFCLAFAAPSCAGSQHHPSKPCTTSLSFLGRSEIPLLTLTGCSHASFGKAIGSTFRAKIRQRLDTPGMGVLKVQSIQEHVLLTYRIAGTLQQSFTRMPCSGLLRLQEGSGYAGVLCLAQRRSLSRLFPGA